MTRGLTRDQIGVTEAMVQAYGERIWELSTNVQLRRGDPVRLLDWDQIEAQRPELGMADAEIADEIGLTRDQVLYIRLLLETRRFRRDRYHRLYELGGGRRFRSERFVPHEDRPRFRDEAMTLRGALEFEPRHASACLRSGYWTADTTARWLQHWASEAPDRPAILAPEGPLSYGRLGELSRRLANGLRALGIRRGDVVAAQLTNSTEFVLGYLAAGLVGAVFCPLRASWRRDRLEPILRAASARAVFCADAGDAYDAAGTFRGIAGNSQSLEHVIVTGADPPGTASPFWTIMEEHAPLAVDEGPVASDPAVLCFTPDARPVIHNYHTLLSNSRLVAPLYDLGADDRVLCALPFSHAIGLSTLNLALHAGSTTIVAAGGELADAARDREATVLFISPRQVASVFTADARGSGSVPSLRKVTLWGGDCPEDLARSLEHGLPSGSVARMWGMTECLIALHTPFDHPTGTRLGELGKPVTSFSVRVVSSAGTVPPPGQEGEIEVLGCSLFAGYPGDAAAARAPFSPDGWFRTGDLGVMDGEGNLRMTGRVDGAATRDDWAATG